MPVADLIEIVNSSQGFLVTNQLSKHSVAVCRHVSCQNTTRRLSPSYKLCNNNKTSPTHQSNSKTLTRTFTNVADHRLHTVLEE